MKKIIVILGLAISMSAAAEDIAKPQVLSAQAVPQISEIDNNQMELMVLDSRLKKLESQAKVEAKRQELARFNPVFDKQGYGVPVVKSIEGIDGQVFATIIFPTSGIEMDAVAGDVLPNGMKVTKIAPGVVKVKDGKKEVRLGFIQAGTNQANGMGGGQQFAPAVNGNVR